MAVRDALLVLLLDGPAYGFQLHGGLAARTGGRREINVGQTYATLDRLRAQELIEPAGTTDDGLPLYRPTVAGRASAAAWLAGADAAGADPWHETIDRVLLALSLPSVDATPVLVGERERWAMRRAEAERTAVGRTGAATGSAPAALAALADRAELARAEAAIAWLELVGLADADALEFAPSTERPRRGRRPARRAPEPQPVDA